MSYGIIRIQKMTSGSVRGVDIHDNRLKEFSHTNQDIDFTKSEYNYKLKESEKSFYNSVNDRIKELKLPKAVRKDAVVMSQALVTSDKPFFDGLSKEQQDDFFKKSYEFIENRYGKENIISATVHLDEKTPHMHVNFVPVTSDGRLCAKDLLNRKEMQSLQNDAHREVFKSFDLERGVTREDKRKHLSVEEFKIKTKTDELAEKANQQADKIIFEAKETVKKNIWESNEMLSKGHKELEEIEGKVKVYETKLNTIQSKAEGYKGAFEMMSDIPHGKTGLLGSNVTFTKEEADKLIRTAEASFAKEAQIKDFKSEFSSYKTRVKKKLDSIPRLQEKAKDLTVENEEIRAELEKTKKVLEKNPELKKSFLEAEKALTIELQIAKKAIQKTVERDR